MDDLSTSALSKNSPVPTVPRQKRFSAIGSSIVDAKLEALVQVETP